MSAGQGPGGDSILPLSGSSSYQNPPQVPSNAHHSRNAGSISAPSTALPSNMQGFGTPQRGQGIGGAPDQMYHGGGPQNPYTPQSAHHSRYSSQSDILGGQAPNIQFQQATPQGSQFNTPSSGVPDALQPGGSARGSVSSNFNAPSTVPSMPSSGAQQHYVPPPRAGILGSSHSHSKSSPIGMDQKYIPFSSTTPSVTPGGSSKMFPPQTPTGVSHSPLGLSDIRPSLGNDLGIDFAGPSATYDASPVQTNSNYLAPWATYAYDWCKWPVSSGGSGGKMALGSYLEDPHNFIQILDTQVVPQEGSMHGGPSYGIEFTRTAEATCAYPVTRISWEPPSSQKQSTDLLATSGDHLRLWSLPPSQPSNVTSNINRSSTANTRDAPIQKLLPLALLSNSKTPEHTAPLTSLDWNTLSPKLIITSSIDTTCTIWDIPTLTAKTQLIAHDKEVYDVRFCAGSVDVFVSCGADGSVRMFDLRSLEHSTIIYEPSEKGEKDKVASPVASSPSKQQQQTLTPSPPLLRLAASPHDSHLLATFAADSNLIRILDVRQPGNAIIELHGHGAALNSIEWSPSRRGMLASGADDSLVLVWDLLGAASSQNVNGSGQPGQTEPQIKYPSANWRCGYEVSNISWAPQSVLTSQGGDWLGVCGGRGIWGVKL
ncbi:WD40-repeat-containing domain protein [Elsinoe ampelina]|uniref:WD40-repeat-containing domain protein n=1 Tax=Elsinoe ampelina TaxID=302913 RepID=A0A6A6GE76_9PEZI|nr:WD40-repeat-containing domain protein [Elsinoe ampelina]